MESLAKKIISRLSLSLFFGFLLSVPSSRALENGLALTPSMGWNSWNRFACHVTEDLVKSAADALVSSGMKDAGYEYIVIDDCWQVSRDDAGNIVADAKTFPSGPKNLSLTLPLFGRPW
jgi:alpha-galactosidase